MAPNLPMFGVNILFLILLLLGAGVLLVLVVAAWTGVSIGVWQVRRKAADGADRRRKLQPDGTPYPPAGRGLCDECARSFDVVYHLDTGRRLCAECFRRWRGAGGPPAVG